MIELQAFLEFIRQCPDSFHTAATVANRLQKLGYTPLQEESPWALLPGGSYYVTRNQSSLIAFRIPETTWHGFMITASHGDTPCWKLKPSPAFAQNGYLQLNTEPYGGMLLESWLDRPLSLSGRVMLETDAGMTSRLFHMDQDLCTIPSLAPHLKTAADKERPLNPQTDLLPLLGMEDDKEFLSFLAEYLQVLPEQILDSDIFLHCRQAGCLWGKNQEFLSAPRLDDLLCVYSALEGFVTPCHLHSLPVFALFDNEEVGSGTKQGAKSTFLSDTLTRISHSLGLEEEAFLIRLRHSFLLSCDNGHALHPNRSEKADKTCRPTLNGGVLLKYNANQRYTTDAVSGSLVRKLCHIAQIPLQTYCNRSDIPGGSTLGNLACEKVSVNSADIGVAQLAMHSAWETAGVNDFDSLSRLITAFYQTSLQMETDGTYTINYK